MTRAGCVVALAARALRELREEAAELGNIALEKEFVRAVQRVEVAVKKLRRQGVIERMDARTASVREVAR